jgi:DNA-binding beta-propeller fold protein YncE
MPEPTRRRQRRAEIARARERAKVKPKRNGRRRLVVPIASVAILAIVGGVAWFTLQPALPSTPTPASRAAPGASVTAVALPTFGADVATNELVAPPGLATPTAGVAGPTAVVVTNSPWQVVVGRGVVRDLTSPSSVAVDGEGNLYVVDFEGNFVQKFSAGGQPLIRFGQKGNAPGQFAGPMDVAVDGQGNIYVADTNNQRIQKLSSTGQPLASWGSGGDGAGQFWLPSGVAVDDQGKVYVADRGNHRIQVLSPTGQPLAQLGTRGPGPGQFWSPADVAVDRQGLIYVADSSNQRVQVVSASGQPISQWGWEGTDPGLFELPSSVAVDSTGNVFVADTRNGRIQKLSSSGQPLAVWGSTTGANTPRPAPEPGTFATPGGIAVDAHGAIFVADTRNQRIQKLAP